MKIILGLTGSVAAKLAYKIYNDLRQLGDVYVVSTEKAKVFYDCSPFVESGVFFDDKIEWSAWTKKGDPVLHIDLRKEADAMVIAPLTANTMGKMAHGICDNMLTSIVRAWDWNKPMVLAPAMNTFMWESPLTAPQIKMLEELGATIVPPAHKELACGDIGDGALADIKDIVKALQDRLVWKWPLAFCNGIPVGNHPGAFGYRRKHDVHTGVDLYTYPNERVTAMEYSTVIAVVPFTGKIANYPWWKDTYAVVAKGASGYILYGEINTTIKPGRVLLPGDTVGYTTPVLPPEKLRKDIPGHSTTMLHVELYNSLPSEQGIWEGWKLDGEKPSKLTDPTEYLLRARPERMQVLQLP